MQGNEIFLINVSVQLHQCVVIAFVTFLSFGVLLGKFHIFDFDGVFEVSILSREKLNMGIERVVCPVGDYVSTGQHQIFRDQKASACLAGLCWAFADNGSDMSVRQESHIAGVNQVDGLPSNLPRLLLDIAVLDVGDGRVQGGGSCIFDCRYFGGSFILFLRTGYIC